MNRLLVAGSPLLNRILPIIARKMKDKGIFKTSVFTFSTVVAINFFQRYRDQKIYLEIALTIA
jgi:multisubunit Na+/H+ antiporter MnhF subunit